MPSIQGPEIIVQSGSAPVFKVDPAPHRFYACELATNPLLFDTEHHGAERTEENFYASWAQGGLVSTPTFQLADEVWRRFNHANRLYYRALTSAHNTEWVNVQATAPDSAVGEAPFAQLVWLALGGVLTEAQTPIERLWAAVRHHEVMRPIADSRECELLIAWHLFSPRRPIDERAAEWVVVAATPAPQSDNAVRTGLVRLESRTLALKDAHGANHTRRALFPTAIIDTIDSGAWQISPAHIQTVGSFLVVSSLRPPPGEVGGTIIAHLESGQLLYHATTAWQSLGQVLLP